MDVNDLLTEDLAIDFCGDVEQHGIVDSDLLSVNHFGRNWLQHLLCFISMEECCVLDLTLLELRLDPLRPLHEVCLVHSRERQDAARVDAHTLDGELLGWEVTALNQEGFVDVVGDAGEELNLDLELLLG